MIRLAAQGRTANKDEFGFGCGHRFYLLTSVKTIKRHQSLARIVPHGGNG
jgi:hypothetical protein